jgi:hypothetical protein
MPETAMPEEFLLGWIMKIGAVVLPRHFAWGMENEYVAEVMQLCFGSILDGQDDIDWLLLLLLASLVHHSKFLQGMKDSVVPNHPFANILIICQPRLLVELKKLVTMKPSECIPNATGIPLHACQGVSFVERDSSHASPMQQEYLPMSRSWLC